MRTIERATQFSRDYKRELKGRHGRQLPGLVREILDLLAHDRPLPSRYNDHPLGGSWSGYRDCHLRPDLILIYRKPGPNTLRLARLGSHSELRT